MAILTDISLARRLERCEGQASAAFVRARAHVDPEHGAAVEQIGDALAMFDGVGSPITQSFGLGLDGAPDTMTLEALEEFFFARGADVNHETSPLADAALPMLLQDRGYRVVEYTSVLVAKPASLRVAATAPTVVVRPIEASEVERWAVTSADGWSQTPELADFIRGFGRVSAQAERTLPMLAEVDGVAAGAAMMAMHDGVALLAGASTIPAFRRRGVQAALLAARIDRARQAGCDLVMMGAAPGSTSQCNAERQGLRVAYTRIKWHRVCAHA